MFGLHGAVYKSFEVKEGMDAITKLPFFMRILKDNPLHDKGVESADIIGIEGVWIGWIEGDEFVGSMFQSVQN